MSSSNYVEFHNIDKSYDGRSLVVDDLNLTIAKGEFLTMLGPSGSGKTTSLMMLAGFEAPSSGSIRIGGRSLEAVQPHRRNIGMVFQNYALFPHLTVAENLDYPLRVRKIAKGERAGRVRRALDMVQMGAMGERKPTQLSGGQQQRIALARAIIFEPDVVQMDEPLGTLDKNLREHLQLEIKHLHERLGITVVYVTHDQSEALTMSDRVAGFIGENDRFTGNIVSNSDGGEYGVRTENGQVISVSSSTAFSKGQPVIVSLRPERLYVDPAAACANRFSGTVNEIIYLGDHRRVHVRFGENATLVAKIPNAGTGSDIVPAQAISLGWNSRDAVLIPA